MDGNKPFTRHSDTVVPEGKKADEVRDAKGQFKNGHPAKAKLYAYILVTFPVLLSLIPVNELLKLFHRLTCKPLAEYGGDAYYNELLVRVNRLNRFLLRHPCSPVFPG